MSKLDTAESNRIRIQKHYEEKFDIVLAATCGKFDGGPQAFDFYESIEGIGRKFGKRVFVPHKEVKDDWDTHSKHVIPNDVVIPTSDLVIGYLSLPSESLKEMIGSARIHRVQTIALCEERNRDKLYEFRGLTRFWKEIVFSDKLEGLTELENVINCFYKSGSR